MYAHAALAAMAAQRLSRGGPGGVSRLTSLNDTTAAATAALAATSAQHAAGRRGIDVRSEPPWSCGLSHFLNCTHLSAIEMRQALSKQDDKKIRRCRTRGRRAAWRWALMAGLLPRGTRGGINQRHAQRYEHYHARSAHGSMRPHSEAALMYTIAFQNRLTWISFGK